MIYELNIPIQIEEDISRLKRSEPIAYKKVRRLLDELMSHPRIGTGQPERLKHHKNETWSRRISKKHRLVYEIYDTIITVKIISAYGHYDDK